MQDNYFETNIGGNRPNTKPARGGISISTLIISIIATAILAFLIAAKWDNILGLFGIDKETVVTDDELSLSIGDDISLTGIISADGDMTNYTHTVNTQDGLFGLKSSKIDLNNYQGEVQFEGFIEKFHQGIPIVSVASIYEVEFEDENTDIQTGTKESKYLPKIGIFFDDRFFEKYALINEGNGDSFKVKELDSNQIIEVQYFVCNKNSMNENCDKLVQNLGGGASQKIVDSYGNTYYKQSEVESWFFTNGLFGYFINDVKDSYVKNLSKYMTIINKKYAQDHISKNVSKLCSDGTNHLNSIEKSDIKLQNSKIIYAVSGKDGDSTEIKCELEIDPTNPDYAKLLNIDVKGNTGDDADTKNSDDETSDDQSFQKDGEATALDPSVKQFPLKPEGGLVYTSNRGGYSLQFPSANIAYEASVSSEDMGNGLKCSYVINVIKYADKDNLKDSPTVQIYECSGDPSATSWAPGIVIYSKANKVFVAKVNDSAWFDFANNLNISELSQ